MAGIPVCAAPPAVVTTLQRVGADSEQYNLVFEAVRLMQLPPVDGFRRTVPHSRFFPLLNFHAVFNASDVQGAYDGNNLGCSTVPGVKQALVCDSELELGDCAPCGAKGKRNVIVIAFINDARYGGTAIRNDDDRDGDGLATLTKVAVFSTRWWTEHPRDKRQFASLFLHELAHAWMFLWDEYDLVKRGGRYPICGTPIPPTRLTGWRTVSTQD
eukprot:gene32732-33095_t